MFPFHVHRVRSPLAVARPSFRLPRHHRSLLRTKSINYHAVSRCEFLAHFPSPQPAIEKSVASANLRTPLHPMCVPIRLRASQSDWLLAEFTIHYFPSVEMSSINLCIFSLFLPLHALRAPRTIIIIARKFLLFVSIWYERRHLRQLFYFST